MKVALLFRVDTLVRDKTARHNHASLLEKLNLLVPVSIALKS